MTRAVVIAAALALALPGGATAASPSASCVGHEASSISPPASSDEFAGGMPQLHDFVVASFPGVAPGAIYSFVARLHEGSHEACDAATG